jgi:FkbM family methyltransferase
VALQWLLRNTVKLAQYGQGIGLRHGDKAALQLLKRRAGSLVIFDVGANRGEYLQLALTELANRPIVIHAFEPSSVAFAELEKRFGGRSGIVLNNLALSDKPGLQTLHYDKPGSELSSLYARKLDHHGIQFSGGEEVQAETLDDYCRTHQVERIDLLKLDVEGHELSVLNGAAQVFERSAIGKVSFEFGGCNIDSRTYVRDFFDFFAVRNMKLSRVTASGSLHPIPRYEETLEQFRVTSFVAERPSGA